MRCGGRRWRYRDPEAVWVVELFSARTKRWSRLNHLEFYEPDGAISRIPFDGAVITIGTGQEWKPHNPHRELTLVLSTAAKTQRRINASKWADGYRVRVRNQQTNDIILGEIIMSERPNGPSA